MNKTSFRPLNQISEVFNIPRNTVLDIIKKYKITKEVLGGRNYIDIQKFYTIYTTHYNPCLFGNDAGNTKIIENINQISFFESVFCKEYKIKLTNNSKISESLLNLEFQV